MNKLPSVSIIFPNYNGRDNPLNCIKSINNLNYPKNKIETIVVDNGSTDGSLARLMKNAEKNLKLSLIQNKTNLGFAKAINQGVKKSKGELILITNDDVLFDTQSLDKLVDYYIKNNSVGVVGAFGYKLNSWTGHIYPVRSKKTEEPDWVQGSVLLVSKKLYNESGRFDEEYSHFFEDLDLCFRLKSGGKRIVSISNTKIIHLESRTADKNKPRKYYHWYRNKFRFIIKNMPLPNLVIIFIIQLFIITPYRAIMLRDGRFVPFIKGLFWNIKNFNHTLEARKQYD